MNRKIIALILTMLMCLTTVIIPNPNTVTAYAQGKTLYVGGTGPGNYSSIQTAIGDAAPDDKYPWGDDISLFSSSLSWFWTPYLEFTFNSPISCDKLKFHAWHSTLHCNRIDIDAFYPRYEEGTLAQQTGL